MTCFLQWATTSRTASSFGFKPRSDASFQILTLDFRRELILHHMSSVSPGAAASSGLLRRFSASYRFAAQLWSCELQATPGSAYTLILPLPRSTKVREESLPALSKRTPDSHPGAGNRG